MLTLSRFHLGKPGSFDLARHRLREIYTGDFHLRPRRRVRGFFLALTGAMASPAGAHHLYSMPLADLLQIEIKGSTQSSENIETVPSAVTVFTHEQIQQLGVSSLDELLDLVPGMQLRRNPNGGIHNTASARGRSITSSSTEIALFQDGVRVVMPRGGGPSVALTLPVQHIERIEVIRGPGSAVYGAGAMLAVVNIVSRQQQNELLVETGSFNQISGGLLAGGQSGDWQINLAVGGHHDEGDQYQLPDSFTGAPVDATDPWQKSNLQFQLQRRSTTVGVMLLRQETAGFYTVQNLAPHINFTDTGLNVAYLRQQWTMGAVAAQMTLSRTHVTELVHAQLSAPGALAAVSEPSSADPLIAGANFHSDEWRLLWHNEWVIDQSRSWQFGLEWLEQSAEDAWAHNNFDLEDIAQRQLPVHYYNTFASTSLLQSQADNRMTGVYGQYLAEPWKGTRLTLGARYDHHDDFGGEFSPRLGWVQSISPHNSLKLLYGEAYRAPVFNETNLENNPVLLGNPDLEPEAVRTWDLIWVVDGVRALTQLGYFESHFERAIVELPVSDRPSTRHFVNTDHDPIKGLEAELRYQLTHWEIYGSFTRLLETSDLTFREAENTASLNLDYQREQWNLSLTNLYRGSTETPSATAADGRDTLPSYWTHALKLTLRWNHHLETYARLGNFTDEHYYSPGQSQTVRGGVPHRGSHWQVGLVWQLDHNP